MNNQEYKKFKNIFSKYYEDLLSKWNQLSCKNIWTFHHQEEKADASSSDPDGQHL